MGLSLGPEPNKNSYRLLFVLALVFIMAGLLWWQKDRFTGRAANLPAQAELPAPVTTSVPAPPIAPPAQVKLVYSTVVTSSTAAFTADLYLPDAEHPDKAEWTGINGRTQVETYTVQAGDTLWGIAAGFGLNVDTLRWSNPALERNPDLLSPGTELLILPVAGAIHTVEKGDTLAAIAARYGVADVDITNYPPNNLSLSDTLQTGAQLIIPNGRKNISIPPPPEDADYPLAWPLLGTITQRYHANHRAIDIGSVYGAKVYAADAGTVIHAEWARTGYGYTVIIAHPDNRQTLYSHLKGALVQKGEAVAGGQVIGRVGSTGNSTGPHLHYEIRINNVPVDPLTFEARGYPHC
jgi:murein DD-endopeptidase MepM/ murein hydrolase activator NlpD